MEEPAPVTAPEPAPEEEPKVELASSEPAPEPTPDPAAICERLCERVESSCKKQAVEACRAGCSDYVATWEQCPVEVEEALTCQTEAKDAMVCTNLAAASCVPEFTALTECRAGRAEPKARRDSGSSDEASEKLPPGWQRYEDADLGISVPFPSEVTRDSSDAGKRVLATDMGIEYLIESPPRMKGQATDRALLKAVLDYLDPGCHKTLKVHGRFETGEVVHVHFDAACKDGVHWRGMLHVSPDRMVTTAARATEPLTSKDVSPRVESLLYGLRFVNR